MPHHPALSSIASAASVACATATTPDSPVQRFSKAVEAGKTIALSVAKEPRAVIVYYFRDAARAGETLERLMRLSVSPAVVYVSGDGQHRAANPLDPTSALATRAIDWLTRVIIGRAGPTR